MLQISDPRPIRTALAAFGLSGRVFHAPLLHAHEGFRLCKVVERDGGRRAEARYAGVRSVRSFTDLLDDREIDLVVVNTPEYTHYDLARQALEAGKHVIVEKAFTVRSEDGQALIELAAKRGLLLSVYQNSRWHGDFITLSRILAQGLLGRLVSFEARYDRYRPGLREGSWKEIATPGTGSLYNLGVHLIDQALTLFGIPTAVFAVLDIRRPGGAVTDYVDLRLCYPGWTVRLGSSYLVREPGPRYLLHGVNGSFVKYGADPQEAWLQAGGSPLDEGYGREPAEQWGKLNTRWGDLHVEGVIETAPGTYMGFYDNIQRALTAGEPLAVTPEQALAAVKIIEAAMESQALGRLVTVKP